MPSTPRDNEKVTSDFRLAMLEKLNANSHKKHWNKASVSYLFNRLIDEVDELHEALFLGHFNDAMKECADVANLAMMIWDNLKNGIIDGSNDSEYLEPKKD